MSSNLPPKSGSLAGGLSNPESREFDMCSFRLIPQKTTMISVDTKTAMFSEFRADLFECAGVGFCGCFFISRFLRVRLSGGFTPSTTI